MKPVNLTSSLLLLASVFAISLSAEQPDKPSMRDEQHALTPSPTETSAMKIHLLVDGKTLTATLDDNPTSRDFFSMLPLTLTLEDYAGTEKIAYLSRKLSQQGAPKGVDPSVGDLTYYAPWGNLALFYRDFGYANGLIKLGSIDEGADAFNVSGSVTITIEPWQEQERP